MEVYANVRQRVSIDPKHVIEKLIENEIGHRGWIKESGERYYKCYEESMGCSHSIDAQDEITKVKFDYLTSLSLVLTYLNED